MADLEKRWIPDPENQFYRIETGPLVLNPDEEAWLAAHPVIDIAVTTFASPIDIVDEEGTPITPADPKKLSSVTERVHSHMHTHSRAHTHKRT